MECIDGFCGSVGRYREMFFRKIIAHVLFYNFVQEIFKLFLLSNAQMPCGGTFTTLQKTIFVKHTSEASEAYIFDMQILSLPPMNNDVLQVRNRQFSVWDFWHGFLCINTTCSICTLVYRVLYFSCGRRRFSERCIIFLTMSWRLRKKQTVVREILSCFVRFYAILGKLQKYYKFNNLVKFDVVHDRVEN